MRLCFANGEHADFLLEGGAASLGNAGDNTLVLASRDVAPWHARLTEDSRGLVLEVLDPTAHTHVNARPVREKALVRCGDVVCLGKVTIAVKADRDDSIETSVPAERALTGAAPTPSRVILRGVSGSHFGRTVAVNHRVVIGSARDCGLVIDEMRIAPRHVAIENIGEAIYLRNLDAREGTFVNGVRVSDAVIHPGDQIAFERNHFIVEAPGLPLRGRSGSTSSSPPDDALVATHAAVDPATRSQGALWWLLGAAAVIAACLGLLIHRGF